MTTATAQRWLQANQHYIMTALEVVRLALAQHVTPLPEAERATQGSMAQQALKAAAEALPAPAALETLSTGFELLPFERDLLLGCAGIELDASFAALCATAHGDPQRPSSPLAWRWRPSRNRNGVPRSRPDRCGAGASLSSGLAMPWSPARCASTSASCTT